MWLYNSVIIFYRILILFASAFVPKAKKLNRAYSVWENELTKQINNDCKWIWFHCSSSGEFEDGRRVFEELRKKYPHYKFLLTFFSSTGYEAYKNSAVADAVSYLPLDTHENAGKFLEIVKPQLAIFSRNDIWANYLMQLQQRKIPSVLISFQFSEKSNFLKYPVKKIYQKLFNKFDLIFVQHAETKNILATKFNFIKSIVSGNPRIDRIVERYKIKIDYPSLRKFSDSTFCVIAGSMLKQDQEIIIETILKLIDLPINWILVPHEINNSDFIKAKSKLGNPLIAYSEIGNLNSNHKVVWIDAVGILPDLYQFAETAFIGGGFSRMGIHNILEPAVHGCAICFGPNHRGYMEAIDLLKMKSAEIILSADEFENWIFKNYKNQSEENVEGEKNRNYVIANIGATHIIVNELCKRYFKN